jgi:hypothetical protein
MKKLILPALLVILLGACAGAEEKHPAPFALLTLKLEGCASCEGCRTAMRQVVQQEAKATSIYLNGKTLTATFNQARPLPLGKIAKGLEASASHRFSVTKILLSISGTKVTENELPFLKVAETGQLFRLSGHGVADWADGSALTVTGAVRDWKAASPTLEAERIEKTALH